MGTYKQLNVGRLDSRDDMRLEKAAVAAGTTKAELARRYIREGLDRAEGRADIGATQVKELAARVDAIACELSGLREESSRLSEIAYANLAANSWIGKQGLCAAYGSDAARRLAAMLMAMTPAEAAAMLLRMGEHMATTGGDLRRAQAVICDMPGVDVARMGYRSDDEWRAGFDASGDPIPGYVAPIPRQVDDDADDAYADIFYTAEG